MKFLLLSAIGLFIVMVNAMDKKEAQEMFRNMSQDCKEKEKASDADVETMIDEKYPESKEGKCLVACMQEQFGIVDNGKFSEEGFMSVASMACGDDKEQCGKMRELAKECSTVTDPDRCEQSIKIGKCMEEGAKKKEIKMSMK